MRMKQKKANRKDAKRRDAQRQYTTQYKRFSLRVSRRLTDFLCVTLRLGVLAVRHCGRQEAHKRAVARVGACL